MNDVVLVGGGIVGAYAAYFLSKAGLSCLVVDPSPMGVKASTCNPGGINPLHGPGLPGIVSPLAELSFRLHWEEASAIERQSGCGYHLERIDRIELAYDESELDQLHRSLGKFESIPGFSARILNRKELQDLDRRIGPSAIGGLWSRGNGNVSSRQYTQAVFCAAREQGCRVIQGTVTGISGRPGRVERIAIGSQQIPCGHFVLTNGPWASLASQWFGVPIPVHPLKGEMLLVELPEDAPRHHVSWKQFGMYPEPNGAAWLGGTLDAMALYDATPTSAGRRTILDGVARMIPEIRNARVLEHVAALRPASADGLPILDRIANWENAMVVGGCGGKGMLLASGIGFCLTQWIAEGSCALDLEPFRLNRFSEAVV